MVLATAQCVTLSGIYRTSTGAGRRCQAERVCSDGLGLGRRAPDDVDDERVAE